MDQQLGAAIDHRQQRFRVRGLEQIAVEHRRIARIGARFLKQGPEQDMSSSPAPSGPPMPGLAQFDKLESPRLGNWIFILPEIDHCPIAAENR